MATLGAQLSEIEYSILHGKPRLKRRGYEQARSLYSSLSSEKRSIDASIRDKADDEAQLAHLRASAEQLEAYLTRLDSLVQAY